MLRINVIAHGFRKEFCLTKKSSPTALGALCITQNTSLFSLPRRNANPVPRPGQRMPPRPSGGKPSSTDPGFSLDSLVGSSDDEPRSKSTSSRIATPFKMGSRAGGGRSISRDGGPRSITESTGKTKASPTSVSAVQATSSKEEPLAPPSFLGIVDADGDVVALESDDERHLPFLAPGDSDMAQPTNLTTHCILFHTSNPYTYDR